MSKKTIGACQGLRRIQMERTCNLLLQRLLATSPTVESTAQPAILLVDASEVED
jgi:hypothetical protein